MSELEKLKKVLKNRGLQLGQAYDLSDYEKEYGKERTEKLMKELDDWIWLLHKQGFNSTEIRKKMGFKNTRLIRHIIKKLEKEKELKKRPAKFLRAY